MSILERALSVWTKHWQRLLLAQLVGVVLPSVAAAAVAVIAGLFTTGILDGARAILFNESTQGISIWAELLRRSAPAGLLAGGTYLLVDLLTSAGNLGMLRPIIHEGRSPILSDFADGIMRYSGRLLLVRVLQFVVLAIAVLGAFVVTVVASWILASWLVPVVVLLFVLLGIGAVLYAEVILVVEPECTAWEAISDSVEVLFRRWKEALTATLMIGLFLAVTNLGGKLFALMGSVGLLLAMLLSALVGGMMLIYLPMRYIENVLRGLYARNDRFAIDP